MKQLITKTARSIARSGRNFVAGMRERKSTRIHLLDLAKQQKLTYDETTKLLRKYKNGRVLVGPGKQKQSLLRSEARARKARRKERKARSKAEKARGME